MIWAWLYRQKPSRAHGFCTLGFDLFFMLCERGCIDQKRHRLTKKYNLAQIRHDFNTIFKFSEWGCIVKKLHKLMENTTSLSLSVSASSGSLYLSVSVCLSLLVCLCLSVSFPVCLSPNSGFWKLLRNPSPKVSKTSCFVNFSTSFGHGS